MEKSPFKTKNYFREPPPDVWKDRILAVWNALQGRFSYPLGNLIGR